MSSPLPTRNVWYELAGAEQAGRRILAGPMSHFERAVKIVYNAGTKMPTLASKRHGTNDLNLSALHLSRTLADLRAVWLLILQGHTAPAASVAAALFEHALASACVAGDEKRASKVATAPEKLPWDVASLYKMFTRDLLRAASGAGADAAAYERRWRLLYGEYLWLCRIKHPTVSAVACQAGATALSDGTYAVGGAPDVRDVDLVIKAVILHICIEATLYAVNRFGAATQVENTPEFQEVADQLGKIGGITKAAIDTIQDQRMPFDLGGTALAIEYNNLGPVYGEP